MRYVIAMIFAAVGAALAFKFLGQQVADWGLQHMSFESPEQNDAWEVMFFMATCTGGLVAGWLVGWVIGGPLRSGPRPS